MDCVGKINSHSIHILVFPSLPFLYFTLHDHILFVDASFNGFVCGVSKVEQVGTVHTWKFQRAGHVLHHYLS